MREANIEERVTAIEDWIVVFSYIAKDLLPPHAQEKLVELTTENMALANEIREAKARGETIVV